jgi:hypothetical protein
MYVFKRLKRHMCLKVKRKRKRFFNIFIQVIMLHHQILRVMIMNRLYRIHHLKQVVVQQVQQNEVRMMVQQQQQHRVYIQMTIHQQMNNKYI